MDIKVRMTNLPKPASDITEIIQWFIGATMFCISWIYFVNRYFKSKSEEKREFIQNVVKSTIESCLLEFKSDFHEFRINTERQMTDFNKTVTSIYRDMKK